MEENIQNVNDELAHWGIKGMRWGVRRYQNKDGSLTAKGRKRYNEEVEKLKKEEQVLKRRASTKAKLDKLEAKRKELSDKKKELDEAEKAAKSKKKGGDDDATANAKGGKKSVKDMTDEELANAVMRSRMESEYARLNPEPIPKETFTKRFMNESVRPAAINAGRDFLQNTLKKLGDKMLADKIDPESLEGLKQAYEKTKYKIDRDKLLNPDKYLSEEDKTKRQQRDFDKADREARIRGYKDAADEAKAKRDADDAARVANEKRSQAEYSSHFNLNGTYSIKGGEKTNIRDAGSDYVKSNTDSGTTIAGLLGDGSNVSSGQSFVGRFDRASIANLDSEDW